MTGQEAIRKGMQDVIADPNWSLAFQPVQVEVAKGGDLGYPRGTAQCHRFSQQEGCHGKGPVRRHLSQEADGSWNAIQDRNNAESATSK